MPAVLPDVAMANWAPISGMGFECLRPLPIATPPSKILKILNLISLGKGLNEVLLSFGWELVE